MNCIRVNADSDRSLNHARQCSRRLGLQALYQWSINHDGADELIDQYRHDEYWDKSDQKYFADLVRACTEQTTVLDQYINSASDYKIDQIDLIELAVLRLATYELLHCQDIPSKVVMAEAIRLCKKFGSDEGFKLVNVILDHLATTIRSS